MAKGSGMLAILDACRAHWLPCGSDSLKMASEMIILTAVT